MSKDEDRKTPEAGWVLFDGRCGFCTWWVPFWSSLLRAYGYDIEELQADWVRSQLGTSGDEILSDIRILKSNGDQTIGADVYREVLKRIWWLLPIHTLSICPGGRQIFDLSYKLFNRNRYWISRTCRMRSGIRG